MISTKTIFLLLRENLQDKFIIFILRRVSHGRGLGLGGGDTKGGGAVLRKKKSQFWKKLNGIQPPHLLVPSGPNPHLYLCYCPSRLFRVPDWATFIHCGSNQWKLWFLGVLKWWNCARHDARRSCSVSVCCEKKQTRFLFSELHCSDNDSCRFAFAALC